MVNCLFVRRVESGDLVSGARTAIAMPFGSGVYVLLGGRMQRTAGAGVGAWSPRFYEAAAGSDLLTLFFAETFNAAIAAPAWFDLADAAQTTLGIRYFQTDKSGNIFVDPNQAAGADTWRAVLYVGWGMP